jgi:hypothetical protein
MRITTSIAFWIAMLGCAAHDRWITIVLALCATGCSSTPDAIPPGDTSPSRRDRLMAPEIECSAKPAGDGRVIVRYEIHNASAEPIHLIDSKRLPYQLVDGSTLVILHGVNPPDPNRLYNMIEIPLTRPLAPSERLSGEQALPVTMLRDHYGEQPAPDALQHGIVHIRCDVGWGTTPITAASRRGVSIQRLLAWQQITSLGPFAVLLP